MLYRTADKEGVGHYHIVFVSPSTGKVELSKASGHTHLASFNPPPEEQQIDPTTGQPNFGAIFGGFGVDMAEGHTHTVENIPLKDDKERFSEGQEDESTEDLSEDDIVSEMQGLYRAAREEEDWSFQQADSSEKFCDGEQWEDVDRQILRSEGRACLTINETKPKIDLLSGYQRQNRTDVVTYPVKGGSALASDLMNIAIKHVWKNNKADFIESKIFHDAIKVGRGVWSLTVDASQNPKGDIILDREMWEDVRFGPHKKEDGSDANFMTLHRWTSYYDLKAQWPDKAKEIEEDYVLRTTEQESGYIKGDAYKSHDGAGQTSRVPGSKELVTGDTGSEFVDLVGKKYKQVQVQRKVFKNKPVVFNIQEDVFIDVSDFTDEADKDGILGIEGFKKANYSSSSIWRTTFAGSVLLENEKSRFTRFTEVPCYGNKVRNKWWGKVHEVKDAQIEVNKRHSQSIDIINKMASYGLGYDTEAFADTRDEDAFLKNRMKPGFAQKFAPGFKDHIHQFEGVRFPSEVFNMAENASNKINVIMNINESMMGNPSGDESGVVMMQKRAAGLIGNETYFDNLSLAKKALGELIVEAIQLTMTPEDILELVDGGDTENDMQPFFPKVDLPPEFSTMLQGAVQRGAMSQEEAQKHASELLKQLQIESDNKKRVDILSVLSDKNLLKFHIEVSEGMSSETSQLAQYAMVSSLAKQGIPIPPDELIMMTPGLQVNNKNRIIQKIAAASQANAMAEQAKNQTEIIKTQIAAASKQQQQPQQGMPTQTGMMPQAA